MKPSRYGAPNAFQTKRLAMVKACACTAGSEPNPDSHWMAGSARNQVICRLAYCLVLA